MEKEDSHLKNIIDVMYKELQNKIENCVIKGLKLKGFEFENRIELEEFLKNRCKKVYNPLLQEDIYYVDDIPFLLHNYQTLGFNLKSLEKNNISFGYYSYL